MSSTPSIAHVHPSTLLPNPHDKRDRTTPEYREWEYQLAQDVKERGVKNPILAMRQGEKLVILAGMTRWKAAMLACLATVPVLVQDRPLTRGEMLLEQLLENELRKGFTNEERAELYAELMTENGWGQAELARALKVSPAAVSKVLSVSKRLPEDLRALIGTGEGKLGPSVAYLLSQFPDEQQMRDLAARFLKGTLKRDSIKILLDGTKQKRPVKAKPVTFTVGCITMTISGDDVEHGLSIVGMIALGMKTLKSNGWAMAMLPQVVKSS